MVATIRYATNHIKILEDELKHVLPHTVGKEGFWVYERQSRLDDERAGLLDVLCFGHFSLPFFCFRKSRLSYFILHTNNKNTNPLSGTFVFLLFDSLPSEVSEGLVGFCHYLYKSWSPIANNITSFFIPYSKTIRVL